MLLVEEPEIAALLDELQKEFDSTDVASLYPAYLERFKSVEEWKFSSGDFYAPIPYESERMGFGPDKPVKRRYASVDEARELGKYCSGFAQGRRILALLPSEKGLDALDVSLYDEAGSTLEIRTISFKGLRKPQGMRTQLRSLNKIIPVAEGLKIEAGIGIGGAFSVSQYRFNLEGRLLSHRAFSKGWPIESEAMYHYTDDGQLDEIKAGGFHTVWRRKSGIADQA
jgi:hypothetical protein